MMTIETQRANYLFLIPGCLLYGLDFLRERRSGRHPRCWVSTHFIAFLRQGILGDELKELLVKFAGQSLLSNHLTSFRRGVALLQHLGNNY